MARRGWDRLEARPDRVAGPRRPGVPGPALVDLHVRDVPRAGRDLRRPRPRHAGAVLAPLPRRGPGGARRRRRRPAPPRGGRLRPHRPRPRPPRLRAEHPGPRRAPRGPRTQLPRRAAAWRFQLRRGPTRTPGGVYVLGQPARPVRRGPRQAVSINGWSPEQYPARRLGRDPPRSSSTPAPSHSSSTASAETSCATARRRHSA